jgi:hypothetical protein
MEDIRMIGLRCADLGTRSSQGMTTLRPVLIATLRLELGAAAVDGKFGAGAAGSIIGSKQCDGRGDFCGLAEAHRRHLRKQGFAEHLDIGVGNAELSEQRRLDHAGTALTRMWTSRGPSFNPANPDRPPPGSAS